MTEPRNTSHVKTEHPDGRRIVFPFHEEIDRYTLKGALKDADIDVTEFLKHLG
jgi:predicted RNA binding protein YcfA (HicA-like mRNA interferase family)